MKTKLRKISTIALIALLLTISLTAVFALPQPSHKFYGDVRIDGAPADDGILVEAKIAGTTYETELTVDGRYGWISLDLFYVTADDPDTTEVEGGVNGDTVKFYVGGVLATTSTLGVPVDPVFFVIGGSTNLDLAVTGGAPPANVDPVADAGGPYEGEVDEDILFDGSLSDDEDGTIEIYAWTFGDGGTAAVESPSHAYVADGTYPVTLTVTDDDGDTDMDLTWATVTEPDDDDDDDDDDPVVIPGEGFTIDYVTPGDVDYGDTLTVMGSGVTAGNTVELYWDYVTAANLLNATTGLPDGTFESEMDVPSDVYGDHYIWAKDMATELTVRSDAIPVISLIKLSPDSGLEGDDVVVKGYGFGEEVDVNITFSGLLADAGEDETDELGYFEYKF